MLDINRLNVFIQVAATQSCSEAAKRLHLSQPTVSKHIQNLEAELNVKLFDRDGAHLRITNAGMTLLPWARKMVRQSTEVQAMMQSMQESVVGQLRIACSTTAGKYILPQMAARFSQRYPGIKVRILSCGPEYAALKLLNGEAHIGVISTENTDPSLEAQEFFRDTITLIVPANHHWAMRKSIVPEEILEEQVIMREETSGTRKVVLTELAKYDISLDDLNVFLELGNAEAIVRTVAAGYGISFVSSLASACPLERGNVVDVAVDGLTLERKIFMVRKRIGAPHRPRDVFWGFVHEPSNADLLRMVG